MTTTVIKTKAVETVQIVRNRGPYRLLTGGQGPAGNNGNVFSPDSSVAQMIALTQAEYDLIGSPDATTVYVIIPEE